MRSATRHWSRPTVLSRLIAADAVAAWEEDGRVTGFSAVDGGTIHLLVDAACRGKGSAAFCSPPPCWRLTKRDTSPLP